MISVNAFASERSSEVTDFVAYWTLTMSKLRRNEKTPTTLADAREFARSAQFETTRSMMGDRLVAGAPDEVARELSRLAADGEVDELMIVTPAPHEARVRSYELIAGETGPRSAGSSAA